MSSDEKRTAVYSLLNKDDVDTIMSPSPSESMSNSGITDEFAAFQSSEMIVTFYKTKLIYTEKEPIWVHFSVFSSQYQMNDDDLVGICRMTDDEWLVSKPIKECHVDKELEQLEDIELLDNDVLIAKKTCFDSKCLPLADGSMPLYFQFCYKKSTGKQILGKSTPFQIKVAHQLSESTINQVTLTEQQDEDDFIVVRPQESFLKERIEHLTKSNSLLQYLIKTMEKDLLEKTNETQQLKVQLENCNEELSAIKKAKDDSIEQLEFLSSQKLDLDNIKSKLESALQNENELRKKIEKELNEVRKFCEDYERNYKESKETEQQLRDIIRQQVEEINLCQDMVANLQKSNTELIQKADKLNDELDSSKSYLAKVLDERRELLNEQSNWKLSSKTLDESRTILMNRVEELQAINDKKAQEIKYLEEELKHALDNLKNINSKSETEQLANTNQIQKLTLKNDRLNVECIEMKARLEQAKVEYGNIYVKYQNLKRKLGMNRSMSITSSMSEVSTINLPSTSDNATLTNSDQLIDQPIKIMSMEMETQGEASAPPNEELTIEDVIEPEQTHSNVNTAVKTLAVEEPTTSIPNSEQSESSSTMNKNESNIVKMPCTMCDKTIICHQRDETKNGQLKEMIEHFEEIHKQKMCPVCSVLFDTRLPIFKTYFSNHLENHFKQMNYPRK